MFEIQEARNVEHTLAGRTVAILRKSVARRRTGTTISGGQGQTLIEGNARQSNGREAETAAFLSASSFNS
jgi:hypothetical protein